MLVTDEKWEEIKKEIWGNEQPNPFVECFYRQILESRIDTLKELSIYGLTLDGDYIVEK